MPRRRLGSLYLSTLLALGALVMVATPVAATDVATDAEFRAAWSNPAETLITLTADIAIDCSSGTLIRNSATGIVIDGAGHTLSNPCAIHALVQVNPAGQVTLRNLTLAGSALSGRGVDAAGPVVIENSTISGHGNDGAQSGESMTVTNSTISGNGADGIEVVDAAASMTVTGSTISGNGGRGIASLFDISVTSSTVSGNGNGAIHSSGGDVTITGTTVATNGGSDDTAVLGVDVTVSASTFTSNRDYAIRALDEAVVVNTTITGHLSLAVLAGGSIDLAHSTLTDNQWNIWVESSTPIDLFGTVLIDAVFGNCTGPVNDQGFNFVDDASCAGILPNAADPQLGTLAGNGGPTQTRLPADSSPLVDAIPAASCAAAVTADQRGVARPQGTGCDIGSVEVVPPAASITDVSVTEGNSGTVNAVFTVTLSRSTTRTVTIGFATANGTATAPTDYLSAAGTITFAPGDTSEPLTVQVVGDTTDEVNETFVVTLSTPSGASMADAQGTGTILDDDGPSAGLLPDTATTGSDERWGIPAAGVILAMMSASALWARLGGFGFGRRTKELRP